MNYMNYPQYTQTLRHLLRICNVSAEILNMSDMWKHPGILFPSLGKVGSTLYEMVSQNAEKFHLEDRKQGFLSCTFEGYRGPKFNHFPIWRVGKTHHNPVEMCS